MDVTVFVCWIAAGLALIANIGCIIWPEGMIRLDEYWRSMAGLKVSKNSLLRSPGMTRGIGIFSLIILLTLVVIYILDTRGWK